MPYLGTVKDKCMIRMIIDQVGMYIPRIVYLLYSTPCGHRFKHSKTSYFLSNNKSEKHAETKQLELFKLP